MERRIVGGVVPILNRFGQSLPPVFATSPLQRMHRKKRALAMPPILTSLSYLVLAGVRMGSGHQDSGR